MPGEKKSLNYLLKQFTALFHHHYAIAVMVIGVMLVMFEVLKQKQHNAMRQEENYSKEAGKI